MFSSTDLSVYYDLLFFFFCFKTTQKFCSNATGALWDAWSFCGSIQHFQFMLIAKKKLTNQTQTTIELDYAALSVKTCANLYLYHIVKLSFPEIITVVQIRLWKSDNSTKATLKSIGWAIRKQKIPVDSLIAVAWVFKDLLGGYGKSHTTGVNTQQFQNTPASPLDPKSLQSLCHNAREQLSPYFIVPFYLSPF